jgi:CBS domain-containing protein
VLPVVDDGELVGIVTDRDMFIALGTRNTRAALLRVGAVATTKVVTCPADDEVEAALSTMKARVRRLPAVDANRKLIGILSLNDIVLTAGDNKPVRDRDVMDALRSICAHRRSTDQAAA